MTAKPELKIISAVGELTAGQANFSELRFCLSSTFIRGGKSLVLKKKVSALFQPKR